MNRWWMIGACLVGGCDFELVPEPDRDLRLAAEAAQEAKLAQQAHESALATQPTFDNSSHCEQYIAHFNTLACVDEAVRLRAALQCTTNIDDVRCDQTAFWSCTTERTRCGPDGLVQPGPGDCPAPCSDAR